MARLFPVGMSAGSDRCDGGGIELKPVAHGEVREGPAAAAIGGGGVRVDQGAETPGHEALVDGHGMDGGVMAIASVAGKSVAGRAVLPLPYLCPTSILGRAPETRCAAVDCPTYPTYPS